MGGSLSLHHRTWPDACSASGSVNRRACVDAPEDARSFSDRASCDRQRSCVRPCYAALIMPLVGMAMRGSAPEQNGKLKGSLHAPGWPDPISSITCPYGSSRSSHPDSRQRPLYFGSADCRRRFLVVSFVGDHRPDRARHLVGESDGDEHARLARQHAGQPRAG